MFRRRKIPMWIQCFSNSWMKKAADVHFSFEWIKDTTVRKATYGHFFVPFQFRKCLLSLYWQCVWLQYNEGEMKFGGCFRLSLIVTCQTDKWHGKSTVCESKTRKINKGSSCLFARFLSKFFSYNLKSIFY